MTSLRRVPSADGFPWSGNSAARWATASTSARKRAPETLLNRFVVRRLTKKFGPGVLGEACLIQGAMRLASAETSSAAKVSTSPRLCAWTRRTISASQAASMSDSGGSCSDSRRSSTMRDRSSGASDRPRSASSATTSAMVHLRICADDTGESRKEGAVTPNRLGSPARRAPPRPAHCPRPRPPVAGLVAQRATRDQSSWKYCTSRWVFSQLGSTSRGPMSGGNENISAVVSASRKRVGTR